MKHITERIGPTSWIGTLLDRLLVNSSKVNLIHVTNLLFSSRAARARVGVRVSVKFSFEGYASACTTSIVTATFLRFASDELTM